jgi:ferredoxin
MPKIKFLVEHHEVDVRAGRSVREVALEVGIFPNREFFSDFTCGGRGLCGTCKVWVRESASNAASPPNLRERFHGAGNGRRLACQTRVLGDIEVTTMPGGHDRTQQARIIDPAPQRPADPDPPPKADKPDKPSVDKKPKDEKPKDEKPKDEKPKDEA